TSGSGTVARETQIGLVVGLVFIGLFGLILSLRAGSEHASLPTGESRKYSILARTLRENVDPFLESSVLEIAGSPPIEAVAETREEPMPAPADGGAPVAVAEAAASEAEPTGIIAAVPVEMETPVEEIVRLAESLSQEAPAPSAPQPAMYRVRSNDTLAAIARRFYGSDGERLWRQIYEANRERLSDPNRLVPGQELVIPGAEATQGPLAPSAPTALAREDVPSMTTGELAEMLGSGSDLVESPAPLPVMYTVERGDTFYSIAEHLYGSPRYARLLQAKNKHLVADPRQLRAGQKILLLEGVSSGAAGEQVAMR
ncbi:MAG: LysM peptidoglycan-binding domain-containing protein, partial [Phycisphaerae bacterium]